MRSEKSSSRFIADPVRRGRAPIGLRRSAPWHLLQPSIAAAAPSAGRRWILPPLPLLTVAALLPRHWELRLVDLAIGDPLPDELLRWADAVFLTGMLVQRASLHAVIGRCRSSGFARWWAAPTRRRAPSD